MYITYTGRSISVYTVQYRIGKSASAYTQIGQPQLYTGRSASANMYMSRYVDCRTQLVGRLSWQYLSVPCRWRFAMILCTLAQRSARGSPVGPSERSRVHQAPSLYVRHALTKHVKNDLFGNCVSYNWHRFKAKNYCKILCRISKGATDCL